MSHMPVTLNRHRPFEEGSGENDLASDVWCTDVSDNCSVDNLVNGVGVDSCSRNELSDDTACQVEC